MAMSALEHEIIGKFRLLDKAAQQRVREVIVQETDEEAAKAPFDFEAWKADIEAVRIILRPNEHGHTPSASDLVREVREERDAELLSSIGLGDSTSDSTD